MAKTTPTPVEELRALGYEVSEPMAGCWYISGFGVETYVPKADAAMLASLTDKQAHRERVKQSQEGPPR